MAYIDYKLYVGDEGVYLKVYTGIDLTSATKLQIHVKKPDLVDPDTGVITENLVEWDAIIHPTDSKSMRYQLVSGDLDVAGFYYIQSYAEVGSIKAHGDTQQIEVFELFK